MKDLYSENSKTPMKIIENNTNKWRSMPVHGLEKLIFLKYTYLLYSTRNSTQYIVITNNQKNLEKNIYIYIFFLLTQSCPTLCNPMDCSCPHRLLCPWDFPGKNTEVGCHFLLQGIFLAQGSKPCFFCLLHFRQILYPLSHQGSPLLQGIFPIRDCTYIFCASPVLQADSLLLSHWGSHI